MFCLVILLILNELSAGCILDYIVISMRAQTFFTITYLSISLSFYQVLFLFFTWNHLKNQLEIQLK